MGKVFGPIFVLFCIVSKYRKTFYCVSRTMAHQKLEQDGRLRPAYFSPNYKYFDQLLETVKNNTTVLNLVFKEFSNINSTTDFRTSCKKVSRFSIENLLSHSTEKLCRRTLLCCVSENVR